MITMQTARARRSEDDQATTPEAAKPAGRWERVRIVFAATSGCLVLGYLGVAAVIALVLSLAGAPELSLPSVLGAAGAGWLAAFQVPLLIADHPLGMLPLLPTALLVALVASAAGAACRRVGGAGRAVWWIVGSTALAHSTVALALSLTSGSGPVVVSVLTATLHPGLLAGAGALVGTAVVDGWHRRLFTEAEAHVTLGFRGAALALSAVAAGAAAVLVVALGFAAGRTAELFTTEGGAGAALGLLLLSLAYLPNMLLAVAAFCTGVPVSLGQLELSLFWLESASIPDVPLLAAVPGTGPHLAWAPVVLGPLAGGLLVGWRCRGDATDPVARLRPVAVSAAVAATGAFAAALLAGGQLADGPFGAMRVPAGEFASAVFCWVAVPGALLAWFLGPRRPASTAAGDADHSVTDPSASVTGPAGGAPTPGEGHDGLPGRDTDDPTPPDDAEVADASDDEADGASPDERREEREDQADGPGPAATVEDQVAGHEGVHGGTVAAADGTGGEWPGDAQATQNVRDPASSAVPGPRWSGDAGRAPEAPVVDTSSSGSPSRADRVPGGAVPEPGDGTPRPRNREGRGRRGRGGRGETSGGGRGAPGRRSRAGRPRTTPGTRADESLPGEGHGAEPGPPAPREADGHDDRPGSDGWRTSAESWSWAAGGGRGTRTPAPVPAESEDDVPRIPPPGPAGDGATNRPGEREPVWPRGDEE
ncbi:cell division protein PerM [Actinoalloteichus caeruleus]|uniref:cell division protein PerM n=1 Tax=Actinoalloteichus cyanogriseus TaxID=2893586 RepID=UPI003BB95FCD